MIQLQNYSVPIVNLIIATMMKRQRKIAKGEVVKIKGANLKKFSFSEKAKNICTIFLMVFTKGQIKPKADWCAADFPKKQRNKFVLFAFLLFTANKTISFVHFLGESMACPNCFRFYLTFSNTNLRK